MEIDKFIIAVLLTEILTELVSEGDIFEGLRWRLSFGLRATVPDDTDPTKEPMGPQRFWGKWVSCGYCFSVAVAIGFAYLFRIRFHTFDFLGYAQPAIWGFVIHRISNMWHVIFILIHDIFQALRTLAISFTMKVSGVNAKTRDASKTTTRRLLR